MGGEEDAGVGQGDLDFGLGILDCGRRKGGKGEARKPGMEAGGENE